jgi:hypothetical protein
MGKDDSQNSHIKTTLQSKQYNSKRYTITIGNSNISNKQYFHFLATNHRHLLCVQY